MKTSKLIGIIVVGVLLLFVFSLVPVEQGQLKNQGAQAFDFEEESITMFRLGDMLGKDTSYICEVFDEDAPTSFQGTLYVEGDMFKTHFETYIKDLDKTISTYALWDGVYIYAWSPSSDIGSRSLASRDDFQVNNNASTNERLYGCVEGDIPDSTFSVPLGIRFETI